MATVWEDPERETEVTFDSSRLGTRCCDTEATAAERTFAAWCQQVTLQRVALPGDSAEAVQPNQL